MLAYLTAHGLTFRRDASNDALENPRNRIRHELLPYLEQHFSPGVRAVLAREAEIARVDAEYLDEHECEAAGAIR